MNPDLRPPVIGGMPDDPRLMITRLMITRPMIPRSMIQGVPARMIRRQLLAVLVLLPALAAVMSRGPAGAATLDWLTGESAS